jgi:hypothetical protein
MLALCPIGSGDSMTGLTDVGFFADVGVLLILATPVVIIYVLWKIFAPGKRQASFLGLDPENAMKTDSGFCWSDFPWKLALYCFLTIMTLIY